MFHLSQDGTHAETLGLGLKACPMGTVLPRGIPHIISGLVAPIVEQFNHEREREREFHKSIQPALAYEDASWLESSAKLRMAVRQWQTAFWSLCHTKPCWHVLAVLALVYLVKGLTFSWVSGLTAILQMVLT